jgi:putative peptidoglycan lipid II flippase
VGSALQVGVQLPAVLREAPDLRLALGTTSTEVRAVVRNFVPAFVSRGVVQISAYVDTLLATLLPTGALAGLMNAQLLYTLPISLFGMSVSAAELPQMSGEVGTNTEAAAVLQRRLSAGLRQIAFFVVPSAAAFLALGDVIAAALFETGRFGHDEAIYVWGILAGSAIGLLPSTLGRLYSSTYYALRDTRTPLQYALFRVAVGIVLGYLLALPVPQWIGVAPRWGAAGLAVAAGLAGWLEMLMLRRTLNRRIGKTGLPVTYLTRLWGAAAAAAIAAWLVKLSVPPIHPALVAVVVLGAYGIIFMLTALVARVPEASAALERIRR